MIGCIEASDDHPNPPRGGVSVLWTITMPLRTAALLIRFNAKDTHWPASALFTGALHHSGYQLHEVS